ncbi:S-adenosylmethionine decarboxylase [Sediminihabitans luteus]|uniref:S-adenosylmethionine decarboxylase n=1 Tax=Sediminihabitans luteus TaxID=1138585 RepID=A0A2M9D0R4_9CELL|nr:S-adenosylmethionine decarboxylase [Sediminihabitans luteus]PJJ77791.1 S-adenosylmethionine decarboxylase [Sediminihabitans luteus]GII99851.1 hypothetical protein Slu03_22290 [Sediminihabitans luteus]
MPPNRNLVYVFDVAGADPALLDHEPSVRHAVDRVLDASGLTRVAEASHRFEPQGFSLAVVLAESHLAVHTWPEDGTAYLTLTTCRAPASDAFEDETAALLTDLLAATAVTVRRLV